MSCGKTGKNHPKKKAALPMRGQRAAKNKKVRKSPN